MDIKWVLLMCFSTYINWSLIRLVKRDEAELIPLSKK